MRLFIAAIMLFGAQISWSMTPFHQHVYSAAQAVSAFYMYELSEGDSKYLDQFTLHQRVANQALEGSTPEEREAFLSSWSDFQPYWKFNQVKGVGLNVDAVIRNDIRKYLTNVFLYAQKLPSHQGGVEEHSQKISLITAMMTARLIDVVASQAGGSGLSEHDRQVNEVDLGNTVQHSIDELLNVKLPKETLAKIRKVNTKFNFIKKSLTNYDAVTPYYLVYKSVMSIGLLLNQPPSIIADS
jgi:hypothetical protein